MDIYLLEDDKIVNHQNREATTIIFDSFQEEEIIESEDNSVSHCSQSSLWLSFKSDGFNEIISSNNDKWLAYLIFFWLGVGNLLPWNAFITAQSYYSSRFCNTVFNNSFENFFSIFFTFSQPVGLFVTIRYSKHYTIDSQVIYPLVMYSIVFFLTTIFVVIQMIPSYCLFSLTLISAFVCGLTGAVMNGGLFALASLLPSMATSALMSGSSLSGVLVSLVNLIIAISNPSSSLSNNSDCNDDIKNSNDDINCGDSMIDYGALSFFILSCLILISCIVFYGILKQLHCVKSQTDKLNMNNENSLSNEVLNELLIANDHQHFSNAKHIIDNQRLSNIHQISSNIINVHPSYIVNTNTSSDIEWLEIREVFNDIKIPAFSVFFAFTVTLSIFPSIVALIKPINICRNSTSYNSLWLPLLFFIYNLFDFIGRLSAELLKYQKTITPNNIWIASSLRIVFIPLFLFCNVDNSIFPVLYKNDVIPIILIILLALTNGYIGNLSMILGPPLVSLKKAPLAGTIMIFFLSFGLLSGSIFSFLLLFIITGKIF